MMPSFINARSLCKPLSIILGIASVSSFMSSFATEIRHLRYIDKIPEIDGIVQEKVWSQATRFLLRHDDSPGKGGSAPVSTEAYVYHDGKNINVALIAHSPNPGSIRAHMAARDQAWDDDLLGIVLDTFNDERHAYEFYVNPLGVQIDARMTDDGNWLTTDSWDAEWSAAAHIDEKAWSAEISIPFEILRFKNTDSVQTWGIAPFRSYQGQTQHWLTNFKRDNDRNCHLCQFEKLSGFNEIKRNKSLLLTPAVTYQKLEEGNIENQSEALSLDLRWAPNSNSVVNATINPDFSQVEADAAQLNINNPFAIYIQEKRPFFLDGAEYLSTDLQNLSHTRSIVNPNFGLKYSSKTGKHSFATLIADDQNTRIVLPAAQRSIIARFPDSYSTSDSFIGRYQYAFHTNYELGLLYTNRSAHDYKNEVLSLDGHFPISKSDTVRFQFSNANSENPLFLQEGFNLPDENSGSAKTIQIKREKRAYSLNAKYDKFEEGFRSDLGFINSVGTENKRANATVRRYGDPGDLIHRTFFTAEYYDSRSLDHELLTKSNKFSTRFEGSLHSDLEIAFIKTEKNLDDNFSNTHRFFEFEQALLSYNVSPTPNLRLHLSAKAGSDINYENAIDAQTSMYTAGINTYLSKSLNIKLDYEQLSQRSENINYHIDGRYFELPSGRLFQADQIQLHINYHFNSKSKLRLISQYTDISRNLSRYRQNLDIDSSNNFPSTEKTLTNQAVLSYQINAGSFIFVGYSDGGLSNGDKNKIEITNRSVFAKLRYSLGT